ncbi:O-methyltransferase [Lysinibacillus irui]|uniref:O-methyltransferase n=1 Tax=Lysinibacillus irui TaxID=2998077 RepID=UPI004044ED16
MDAKMVSSYRSNTYIPELVQLSKALAKKYSFEHSCTDEVGRLLSVLVGQIKTGKILEIGTGFGIGSSWILSAIRPSVHFISVDHSKEKIELVRQNIHHTQADFVFGDWKDLMKSGPFHLIFADAAAAKSIEAESLFECLDQGGLLLMDDFTPEEHFPKEWQGKPDTVREFWLNHPQLTATEIYVTPTSSVILATRIT